MTDPEPRKMPEYKGDRVQIGVMIRGYKQAQARYAEVAGRHDASEATYFALFEALNWAVAVEDVIREVWWPHGKRLGWKWRDEVPGAEVMQGIRMARNLLHHHWASAPRIDFVNGRHGWSWPQADALPPTTTKGDAEAVPIYSAMLAGVSVADTLHSVGAVFAQVGQFVDPPRPLPG